MIGQTSIENLANESLHTKLDGQERWVKHICGQDLFIRAKTWIEDTQAMVGTIFFSTLDTDRHDKNRLKKCPKCKGKLTEYLDPATVRENYLPHNEPVYAFYQVDKKA